MSHLALTAKTIFCRLTSSSPDHEFYSRRFVSRRSCLRLRSCARDARNTLPSTPCSVTKATGCLRSMQLAYHATSPNVYAPASSAHARIYSLEPHHGCRCCRQDLRLVRLLSSGSAAIYCQYRELANTKFGTRCNNVILWLHTEERLFRCSDAR